MLFEPALCACCLCLPFVLAFCACFVCAPPN
jgi:hypothetical protein